MTLDADQNAFLAAHRWALIATISPSLRPQVTMVAYYWDGHDIILSTKRTTTKWANVVHHREICITVTDGEQCLSVYGLGEAIDTDPDRARLTDRLLASLLPEHAAILAADIDEGLDATDRVIVRLTPQRAVGRI